ncbi:hypothetical protein H0H92_007564 [Tricholoma furcatifolium]|nr:hypothetical protein H0H92_007564 [Tricholoma furcatifolium]
MDVFNPKILDASIRDVASCLTDNQKVDLLLYAIRSLPPEGAKARILRARARLAAGSHFGAQEDLQAALVADPDNPEAKALLHQRSVSVEKLLSPLPPKKERFSIEIWREIALYLPRHDLRALLFIPHAVSRVASQLLFRRLDLHFGGIETEEARGDTCDVGFAKDEDARHAQRSADILTRIIIDPTFASAVRTLRIYAPIRDREGALAFQTVRDISYPYLHFAHKRSSPDGPTDLQLEFKHLAHFACSTSGGSTNQVQSLLAQNRDTLRTVYVDNRLWVFPTNSVSIRNLTDFHFSGHIPLNNQLFADIIANGRQLESLSLCCSLDGSISQQFRTTPHVYTYGPVLPFLRRFAFSITAVHRRVADRDLFPAVADFLRGRQQLRSLVLTVYEEGLQHAVGFDASVWGVLPSLFHLRSLKISYPADLSPGLASWLIPRSVLALALTFDHVPGPSLPRDPVSFLEVTFELYCLK